MSFKLNPFTSLPDVVRPRLRWGSFYSTQDQVATSANVDYSITLNNTDADSDGVSIVSNSRVTFATGGVYSVTYSVQLANSDTQIHDVNIWLRKNDSGTSGDLAATDSKFSVIASHGGISGYVIGCVNYVLKLAANDYLELIWSTTNVAAYLDYSAASGSGPAHPSVPSVILTAVQVA